MTARMCVRTSHHTTSPSPHTYLSWTRMRTRGLGTRVPHERNCWSFCSNTPPSPFSLVSLTCIYSVGGGGFLLGQVRYVTHIHANVYTHAHARVHISSLTVATSPLPSPSTHARRDRQPSQDRHDPPSVRSEHRFPERVRTSFGAAGSPAGRIPGTAAQREGAEREVGARDERVETVEGTASAGLRRVDLDLSVLSLFHAPLPSYSFCSSASAGMGVARVATLDSQHAAAQHYRYYYYYYARHLAPATGAGPQTRGPLHLPDSPHRHPGRPLRTGRGG